MKNITKDIREIKNIGKSRIQENQEYKVDQSYMVNQAYKEDEEREENSDVTLYRSKQRFR